MNIFRQFAERVQEQCPSPLNVPVEADDDTAVKLYAKIMREDDALTAVNLTSQPESARSFAERLGKPVEEIALVLERLANNGVVFVVCQEEPLYCLHPIVPGTIEFLVKDGMMDAEVAYLSDQYYSELARYSYPKAPKGVSRILPVQEAIEAQSQSLSYEQVEKYIDAAENIAAMDCDCRRIKTVLGQGCDHPIEGMCLWLGPHADYYVRGGAAKRITKEEARAVLRKAEESGLVHETYIPTEGAINICNCCGCCCPILKHRGFLRSNYIAQVNTDNCTECGECVEPCQFNALALGDDSVDYVLLNEKECIGCGVCTVHCDFDAIELVPREEKIYPPKDMNEFLQEVQEYAEERAKGGIN